MPHTQSPLEKNKLPPNMTFQHLTAHHIQHIHMTYAASYTLLPLNIRPERKIIFTPPNYINPCISDHTHNTTTPPFSYKLDKTLCMHRDTKAVSGVLNH
jgi:hypothetical protein